jgi:hypothetical protein
MKHAITVKTVNSPTLAVYDSERAQAFWGNNFTGNFDDQDKRKKDGSKINATKSKNKKKGKAV